MRVTFYRRVAPGSTWARCDQAQLRTPAMTLYSEDEVVSAMLAGSHRMRGPLSDRNERNRDTTRSPSCSTVTNDPIAQATG